MSVTAYDRVRAAREKNRPTGLDYIKNLFGTFLECHGDRCYADDPAIVGGIAEDAGEAYDLGVTAMFGIDRSASAFKEFASRSREYYQRTLEDVLRLFRAGENCQ